MRTLKHDEVNLVGGGSTYVIEPAIETYSDDGAMGAVLSGLRWFTGLISGSGGSMTVGSSYFIRG